MSDSALRLGDFRLGAPIGRGGFSDVWIATHPLSRHRFAVKTLRGELATNSVSRDGFAREADAVARMSHPSIIGIHDFGQVPDEVAAASEGRLTAGAPYLVMDYHGRGAVREGRWSWPNIEVLLRAVLSALAHAHARAVLHLDIKPANVLRDVANDGSHRFIVSDFGTAALLDRLALEPVALGHTWGGTPMYMAPERLFGREFEQGPWSDLYSLAVMAWMLATGHAPFTAKSTTELMHAHARTGLPVLPDDAAMPEGFRVWLRRAGDRSPERRYQTSAEALAALDALTNFGPRIPTDDYVAVPAAEATPTADPALAQTTAMVSSVTGSWTRESTRPMGLMRQVVPIPEQSEGFERPIGWSQTLTLGEGLLGRRESPLVGREGERAMLWAAFRGAEQSRMVRVVVLEGAAGAGKSRLARWLGESAAEHCGAVLLRATHGEAGSRHDGLPAMLARGLWTRIQDATDLQHWSRHVMAGLGSRNAYDTDSLADIVSHALIAPDEPRPWSVRLSTDAARHEVIEKLLRRLAETRPVVLWLDDVHWGPGSLRLAERIVASAESRPFGLTMVLTARADERDELPAVFSGIDAIGSGPGAAHLTVGPLPGTDAISLLRATFALEHRTAEVLASRSAGNPLLALQLLHALHSSGQLASRKGGWGLTDDVNERPQETMLAVWQRRVALALDAFDAPERPAARVALERAAALGTSIDSTELEQVCSDVSARVMARLLRELIEAQLVELGEGGFSFVHGLLPEAIEAEAIEAGRAAAHHAAIADMLAAHAARDYAARERRALHLERAGRAVEAFDETVARLGAEKPTEAVVLRLGVAQLTRCLDRMSPADADPRRGLLEVFALQAAYLDDPGGDGNAERIEATRAALRPGIDDYARWHLDIFRADARDGYAENEFVTNTYREELAEAEARGDEAGALRVRAALVIQLEIAAETAEVLKTACAARASTPPSLRRSSPYIDLIGCRVRTHFDLGQYSEGVEALEELDGILRQGCSREVLCSTHMLRCESLIRFGEFDAARAALDEALDIAFTTSSNRDILCYVHRTALLARAGDWRACLKTLRATMQPERGARIRGLVVSAIAYASVAIAQLQRPDLWDEHVPDAIADLQKWGFFEAVMARCVADAGVAWLLRGDSERGLFALEAARAALSGARDAAAHARVEALLARPDSVDPDAPEFLSEVRCNLESAPDWLLRPAWVPRDASAPPSGPVVRRRRE